MSGHGLDFVVIGAQKAGTTTLFHHLRSHPALHLPADKEAPFFSRPDLLPHGVDWYLHEFFRSAPEDRLWGTVTPQYMCMPGTAAELIGAFPAVRLVAILRDPIARAASHHQMSVGRGDDDRSFTDAVRAQLDPSAVRAARASRSERDTYVAWSEYGRILDSYLALVPRDQLLIVFTEDLERDPGAVVASVQRFLGVAELEPPDLGARFHVAGGGGAVAALRRWGRRLPGLQRAWHLVPLRHRNRLAARASGFHVQGAEADGTSVGGASLDEAIDAQLHAHLAPEVKRVAALTGTVPWSGWAT